MKTNKKININKNIFGMLIISFFILFLVTLNTKISANKFIEEYNTQVEELQNRIDMLELDYVELKETLNETTIMVNDIKDVSIITIEDNLEEDDSEEDEKHETEVIVSAHVDKASEHTNELIQEAKIDIGETEDETQINDIDTEIVDEVEVDTLEINYTDITQKSNLTAEQFNILIAEAMEQKGKSNSALLNMGEHLKYIEDEYNVNGIFALSISSFESGWGTRHKNNNLFGIASGEKRYSHYGESVQGFGKLIRNHYIDSGLTTVSSISKKYCPPQHEKWTQNISWFMGYYKGVANNIFSATE